MKTRAEKREQLRRNRNKMIISNRGIFTLEKIKKTKANKHARNHNRENTK